MIPENFEPLGIDPRIHKAVLEPAPEFSTNTPKDGQMAEILYKCRKSDYSIVDENQNTEDPFEFEIGTSGIIQGLNIGIKTMKIGEKSVLKIPAELAYGETGSGKIEPNEDLYFELELLNFFDKKKDKLQYSSEERVALGKQLKDEGTQAFTTGNLETAVSKYEEALDMIDWEAQPGVVDMKIALNNNLALVHLKQQKYDDVIKATNKALEFDKKNIKALLRKAKAYRMKEMFEDSIKNLELALEASPEDSEVKKELSLVKADQKRYLNKEKQIFSKLFSQGPLYQEEEDPTLDPSNPKVFMDVKIGEEEPQRLVFQVFKNVVPKTAENFITLCTNRENQTYKDSIFHRLIKGFMIQGGDYENANGTGGKSIYGERFADENFKVKHKSRGLLSMANAGPNTNGSQFFITFGPTPHLDGKHVVFGKLVEGLEVLDKLEELETGKQDCPAVTVKVADCGLLA